MKDMVTSRRFILKALREAGIICFDGGKGDTCLIHSGVAVATYPSTGGRREAHGCVFQGRKTRGVATNVYSRKTLGKPKAGLQI